MTKAPPSYSVLHGLEKSRCAQLVEFEERRAVLRRYDTRWMGALFPRVLDPFRGACALLQDVHSASLVPVLDAWASEGELFCLMPFVEGVSLGEASLPEPEEASVWMAQAALGCSSLYYAALERGLPAPLPGGVRRHGARDSTDFVQRRALAPHHILVRSDGGVRVLGASLLAEVRNPTLAGGMLRYPWSVPPEVVRAEEVRESAHVFMLSAILQDLVTGRPVREEEGAVSVLMAASRGAEPLDPGLSPRCPAALAEVLRRGTRGSAEERTATLAQWIVEVLSWAAPVAEEGELGLDRWREAIYEGRRDLVAREVSGLGLQSVSLSEVESDYLWSHVGEPGVRAMIASGVPDRAAWRMGLALKEANALLREGALDPEGHLDGRVLALLLLWKKRGEGLRDVLEALEERGEPWIGGVARDLQRAPEGPVSGVGEVPEGRGPSPRERPGGLLGRLWRRVRGR